MYAPQTHTQGFFTLLNIRFNLFKDGNNNRIKQWTDALISRGVFEGDLQLADQVVYGDWNINTEVNGNVRQTLRLHLQLIEKSVF